MLLHDFFCRILTGMAVSASFVAIMGILSKLFPDRIATIMATCEAIFGVGFTLGTVDDIQYGKLH